MSSSVQLKHPSFILIGPIEAGKSTLFSALLGQEEAVRKTQAVEFSADSAIDTPGEFFSHPRLYHALITTASDVDTLVYVHPCTELESRMPPGFLEIYNDKDIIAVMTKTDIEGVNPEAIAVMLRETGIKGKIFRVSNLDPASIEPLKEYLFRSV